MVNQGPSRHHQASTRDVALFRRRLKFSSVDWLPERVNAVVFMSCDLAYVCSWKPWLIQTTFSLRPTILFGNSSDKNVNYYKTFPFLFCKKVMVHLCQPKIKRRSIFVGKRWITGCGFHIVNVVKLLKLPHTHKINS